MDITWLLAFFLAFVFGLAIGAEGVLFIVAIAIFVALFFAAAMSPAFWIIVISVFTVLGVKFSLNVSDDGERIIDDSNRSEQMNIILPQKARRDEKHVGRDRD